jgi:hypothetical protein
MAQGPAPASVAFANANLISLEHDGVERGRTILVRGDHIAAIGSSHELKPPADALVLDSNQPKLVPNDLT